ncbi:MAG: 4-hydroxy-3-methylbut-2-enyl diphosphate reductase [Bacteroidales bacterium]|jgi:4-hydroxy-3-methylbut-2-enyl diphosphate reductase
MEIIVDNDSGFCFGVKRAIAMAEQEVDREAKLFCLGDIVHNTEEVNRLKKKGIEFITHETYFTLKDCTVLIRAHGEPPETYRYAEKNDIHLIDATCPVVLKLQEKVKNAQKINPNAQVVIFGRKDHPEIVGLRGQVRDAVILQSLRDVMNLDFTKPIFLFSQTTKDTGHYNEIIEKIEAEVLKKEGNLKNFVVYDSICGQVSNRALKVKEFSKTVDTLIFVGGKTSSNSRVLFDMCRQSNPNSFFVTSVKDLDHVELNHNGKIGVCGATSTPLWLIVEIGDYLKNKYI